MLFCNSSSSLPLILLALFVLGTTSQKAPTKPTTITPARGTAPLTRTTGIKRTSCNSSPWQMNNAQLVACESTDSQRYTVKQEDDLETALVKRDKGELPRIPGKIPKTIDEKWVQMMVDRYPIFKKNNPKVWATNPPKGKSKKRSLIPYTDAKARDFFFPAAAAAYGDRDKVEQCIDNWFGQPNEVVQRSVHCADVTEHICSSYVAVSHRQKVIIVGFRGTDGFGQLMKEGSDTIMKDQMEMSVSGHRVGLVGNYFYGVFLQLWTGGRDDGVGAMMNDVKQAYNDNPTYDIYVAGHSLGGAMASIAAVYINIDILDNQQTSLYLMTFGQPRTGDKDYAKYVDDNLNHFCYRVVNSGDLVSKIPSSKSIVSKKRFQHHGVEIWYKGKMDKPIAGPTFDRNGDDRANKIHKCQKSDFDSKCQYGIKLLISVPDHRNYFGTSVSGFGKAGCPNTRCADQLKRAKANVALSEKKVADEKEILKRPLSKPERAAAKTLLKQYQASLKTSEEEMERLPCYEAPGKKKG